MPICVPSNAGQTEDRTRWVNGFREDILGVEWEAICSTKHKAIRVGGTHCATVAQERRVSRFTNRNITDAARRLWRSKSALLHDLSHPNDAAFQIYPLPL